MFTAYKFIRELLERFYIKTFIPKSEVEVKPVLHITLAPRLKAEHQEILFYW